MQIGMLLFPQLTQLDLTGPFEVLARMPDAEVHIVAKTAQVRARIAKRFAERKAQLSKRSG